MAMRDRRTERQTILFVVAFSGMLFGLSYALIDTTRTAARLRERLAEADQAVQKADEAIARTSKLLDGHVCFDAPPWVRPTKQKDL